MPTTCLEAEVTCGNIADGCGATLDCGGPCPEPVCGNGAIEEGEVCDDGNTADNDYCSADCLSATGSCGDGAVQSNEDCDDGNAATETCAYGLLNCDVCDGPAFQTLGHPRCHPMEVPPTQTAAPKAQKRPTPMAMTFLMKTTTARKATWAGRQTAPTILTGMAAKMLPKSPISTGTAFQMMQWC